MTEDSPRTKAGELSRGQKPFKNNCQRAPTSPHVVWAGFKKMILSHPKTNSVTSKLITSVIRHD